MDLKLVFPTPKDADFWLKVRIQPSTQNNNPIGVLSLEDLSKQISESNQPISKKQKTLRFFIKRENQWVGVIALKDINWNSGVGEVGYLIDESYHNQGIASEALKQLIEIAFFDGGLNRIKATTIVENTSSNRVLEKNGFKKEGILRQEFLVKNKLHDVIMWAVLKSDL